MSAYHDEDEAEELRDEEDPDESDVDDDDDDAPDEADWSDAPPRKSLLWIVIALLVIAAFFAWALHARQ